jgi:hypothetical protein
VELYLHSPNTSSWRGAQLKHSDKLPGITLPLPSCFALLCYCIDIFMFHTLLLHVGVRDAFLNENLLMGI